METFRKLFASLLVLVDHCFDRVVIRGYLPLLTRPEHIVYFFRDVHGLYPITKQALRQKTQDYQHWVQAFARNHRIPLQWPDRDKKKKGLRQEDPARPYLQAMEPRQRFGLYFIFKTLEPGPHFRSCPPKYPTQDPGYRIIRRHWSRYTHYYFYLSPHDYTLNQLRYDLRKMKGHGLRERVDKHYAYRLTEKGARVSAMFVLFHKRICGPLANSLFHHPPRRSISTACPNRNRLS